jgi:putative transposase
VNALNRVYRYRLYPTAAQITALETQLAFACDLYNSALEQRRDLWKRHRQSISTYAQQRQFTEVRQDGGSPPGMNAGCQQEVLAQLGDSFDAFFRRVRSGETAGYPRFKAAARFSTLTWRKGKGGAYLAKDRLRIQGVGDIKVKWHRDLPGRPKQTKISRRNGRWYVGFTVEVEAQLLPPTGQSIGIDLGVRQFATLSDGSHIDGPRPGRVAAPTIRRAQRKVARRQRGSHRRRKAVGELARRREREANRRRDAAHKAAKALVDRFDLVAVEDLRPSNMVRTSRGLAREINDQGWAQFLRCLDEKAESAARKVVRVDPKYTSQRCHECGTVDRDSRHGPRFDCTACGHSADADVNAARNILARARTGPSSANATSPALLEKPETESSLDASEELTTPGGEH